MSVMGSKIDNFSIPICNSFKSTILNDQVCYELDAERFVDKKDIHKDLRLGKLCNIQGDHKRRTLSKGLLHS